MLENRKAEKIGWSLGWSGGFLWILILAVFFLVQERLAESILGFFVFTIAMLGVFLFSPWRNPQTPFWKLFLVPYFIFLLSIIWVIWAYGGVKSLNLNWWNLFWLIPLLIPTFTSRGRRRWVDGNTQNPTLHQLPIVKR